MITLRMTKRRARELGLLTCKNCRWPENNHFNWGKRPCAHDNTCEEFTEIGISGVTVES